MTAHPRNSRLGEHPQKMAVSRGGIVTSDLLGDRLIRLAQEADRAGYRVAAEHLACLAGQMLDEPETLRA